MPSKLAALYDIHGNLPALEAVLDEVRRDGVERIVVGGDVVPGPMPRETLSRLFDLDVPVHFLMGNGEEAALAERAGEQAAGVPEAFREVVRWSGMELDAGQVVRVATWPHTMRLELPEFGTVLFCHATPRSNTEVFTRATPEGALRPIFDAAAASLVVCGHTHMQFDRRIGNTRVVNAGSVGMPFGAPGAYWLLLDDGVNLRRTPYTLERAAARIRGTKYPHADRFAQGNVLQPPSEEEMLRAFAAAQIT